MSQFGELWKHEKTQHAACSLTEGSFLYFCIVNVYGIVVMFKQRTLAADLKCSALPSFELIWKDGDKCAINIVIIVIDIYWLKKKNTFHLIQSCVEHWCKHLSLATHDVCKSHPVWLHVKESTTFRLQVVADVGTISGIPAQTQALFDVGQRHHARCRKWRSYCFPSSQVYRVFQPEVRAPHGEYQRWKTWQKQNRDRGGQTFHLD